MFHKGGGQKNYLFRSLLLLRRGGRRRYEKLLGFFINHAFDGVLQHDSGTPKHAFELKKGLKFLDLPKRVESLWFGTQGP